MWCIGKLTKEYRERMYDLLDIYARPYQENEPVVCVDEKSKQLLEQPRTPIPASPGKPVKEDYEYKRAGTRNISMAIEPKGGRRQVEVTARRTKGDFVKFVSHLAKKVYVGAHKIHLVLDNLNTHFRSSFEEVLGIKRATQLLERVEFHYTPKHASWLNMAEIEIGIKGGKDNKWDVSIINPRIDSVPGADCQANRYFGPKLPRGRTDVIKPDQQ